MNYFLSFWQRRVVFDLYLDILIILDESFIQGSHSGKIGFLILDFNLKFLFFRMHTRSIVDLVSL